MSIVVLDTGVIAEYIDLAGRFHREADAVFRSVLDRRVVAIVPHMVLAETYYVSFRIYQKLGLDHPQERADRLIEWVYRSPNISLAEPSLELALLAGRTKALFGLALTDAYVLASSKLQKGKAVFRSKEKEMVRGYDDLIRDYEIVFLGGNHR